MAMSETGNGQLSEALVIDMHATIIPWEYLTYLQAHEETIGVGFQAGDEEWFMIPKTPIPVYGMQPIPVLRAHFDLDVHLADMAERGVDVQVLSVPTTLFNYQQRPALGQRLASLINEAIAEAAAKHPRHFVGTATVPLQDCRLAVAELQRAVALGLKAITIGSSVNDMELDDPSLWPFWEAAEASQMPIFIHGHDIPGAARMQRWFLSALLGIPVASALALANLIYGGVLEAFPRLRFWIAHGGGVYPYLRGRMDHGYEVHAGANGAIPRPPSSYLNQVLFDSITLFSPALAYLVEAVGEDNIVLGTDYPFSIGQLDGATWVKGLETLPETSRRKILGENALGLLGLPKEAFM